MYRFRYKIRDLFLVILDCLIIVLSGYIANIIRHGNIHREEYIIVSLIQIFLIVYVLMYIFYNFNKCIAENGLFAELINCIKVNICMVVLAICTIYFTRVIEINVSRAIIGWFAIVDTFLMYWCHLAFKFLLTQFYKNSSNSRQLLIVCSYNDSRQIIDKINTRNKWDYCIRGLAIIDADMIGDTILDIPVVANINTISEYCKTDVVDEVLFHTSLESHHLKATFEDITKMGITVHLNLSTFALNVPSATTVTQIGGMYTITFANRFLTLRQAVIKRIMDIMGGLVGSIITLVLILILGPIIKHDSKGPILFAQKRVGKNGRYFKMYKFRSMYVDAEERKKQLMEQNEMSGLMFKMENDPRITKVGAFLRKTSLDEFPQFFNILKGDMSLVGTRPPTVDEFKQYESYHKMRLSIKPGLTGMWQISGRSDITDFEEIVKLDVKYINEWCLSLDIKILLKTIGVVLTRKGAK